MVDKTPTSLPEDPVSSPRLLDTLRDAALTAEMQTGYREETLEEARTALIARTLKAVLGFVIIAIGIAALPLPGPGWLIIIFGLNLLPFAWAERTVWLIRQKIPGVPADGRIPARTWLVMGLVVVAMSVGAVLVGPEVKDWAGDTWTSAF